MSVQDSQELIDDLVEIGTLQNNVPSSLGGGQHSDLGLHVQMQSRVGLTSLKAGGRFFSKIELWQAGQGDRWHVKKYKSGGWERLVKPTLEWAKWSNTLTWEQEAVNEQVAPVEDLSGDPYDVWLLAAKQSVLSNYWAFSRLSVDQFKRTGVLNLPNLTNLDWINLVIGIGCDFGKIRNSLDDLVSEMTDVKERKKKLGVPETKNILAKLEDLHENVGTLHEKLRTIETPERLPQISKEFRSALLSVFLYSSSKVRATQEFYKLLLESNGLVESQKEMEFLTVMAKWLGAHRAEEKEISDSLLALARDS